MSKIAKLTEKLNALTGRKLSLESQMSSLKSEQSKVIRDLTEVKQELKLAEQAIRLPKVGERFTHEDYSGTWVCVAPSPTFQGDYDPLSYIAGMCVEGGHEYKVFAFNKDNAHFFTIV